MKILRGLEEVNSLKNATSYYFKLILSFILKNNAFVLPYMNLPFENNLYLIRN